MQFGGVLIMHKRKIRRSPDLDQALRSGIRAALILRVTQPEYYDECLVMSLVVTQ